MTVPLPAPAAAVEVRELTFTHFTVLLQPDRRLAVVTGVNLDGAQLLDLDRGDDWHLDPRIPAVEQAGPQLYADNDFDRGHLVRCRDPVWGDSATAAEANLDSFTYVNAAPQAALFNQGPPLWAGLEDYLLDHARTYQQRLSVYTAPVLAADDPPTEASRSHAATGRSPPGPPPPTPTRRARRWPRPVTSSIRPACCRRSCWPTGAASAATAHRPAAVARSQSLGSG